MIPQGLYATAILRQGLTDAASSYLKGNHRQLDPYVVPAINAWYRADRTLFRPLDRMGKLTNEEIIAALRRRFMKYPPPG